MDQDTASGRGQPSWQEQRQEAIRQQQQRWQQLHPEQQRQHSTDQPTPPPRQDGSAVYPDIHAVHTSDALLRYPDIPAPSAPPLQSMDSAVGEAAAAAASEADRQRRQQQEEEDYRLAMQLAEQFEAEEDSAALASHPPWQPSGSPDTPFDFGLGSEDEEEWQEIARTASMGRLAGGANAGHSPPAPPAAPRPRPMSQAAAAAGSTAGSLVGVGLSALMAMAAQAAARQANQAGAHTPAAEQAGDHSATAAHGQPSAAAELGHAPAAVGGSSSSGEAAAGTGGEDGGPGVLGMAANALRSFLASRAAANQASSSAAAAASSSGGDHARSGAERRWEDEQPSADDLEMLQHIMQQLMGGNLPSGLHTSSPQATQAGSSSGGAGGGGNGGGSSGFRVTRLPGGGFTATYSSGSRTGPGGVHVQAAAHSGAPFQGGGDSDMDSMFSGPDDLLSQLLLAGARSASANRGRAGGSGSAGFTHYDPGSGTAQFEPLRRYVDNLWEGMEVPGPSLDEMVEALMGPGVFTDGRGGLRYEDLVGLDPVHVTTPQDVLTSLPQSKYVEGRRPGDSDTCVICQSAYAAGDDLTHLPCLHAFHTDCITPWLQGHSRKCPVCKTDVC